MTTPDYATWLTKQQAADAIGVTTKSVERFVQAGQIQQARWQREGRGPLLAVYHPDDVARLAQARQRGPLPAFVVPGSDVPSNGNGHDGRALANVPSVDLGVVTSADDLLRALVLAATRVMSETSQTSTETLWVTVKEAAAILGFPQADVRRLLVDGDLNHRRTARGGIRIRRKDLEAL